MRKSTKLIYIAFLLLSVASIYYLGLNFKGRNISNNSAQDEESVSQETDSFVYRKPNIEKNRSYRIVLVGDSMTRALGPNANKLREYLIEYYPDNEFVIYNYGYSSTNIETLPERLTKKTSHLGTENEAILKQGFELIIIESFGYNPLSYGSIENGLKKQEEVVNQSLKLITKEKPNVGILFMTPIAPDPDNFAKGTFDLTAEMRRSWVNERVKYIENFRKLANSKSIPLIDVYNASLTSDGTVNKSYISTDFIHPSEAGIDLMAREIADFIASQNILPK